MVKPTPTAMTGPKLAVVPGLSGLSVVPVVVVVVVEVDDVVVVVDVEDVVVVEEMTNHAVSELPFLQVAVTVRLSPTLAEMLKVSYNPHKSV